MESSPLICNVNLFPQFYMVGVLSGDYSQADHKFNFNANVNVTVDSYMNRSFNFSFSQFPLNAVLVSQSEDQKSFMLQYCQLGRFIEACYIRNDLS